MEIPVTKDLKKAFEQAHEIAMKYNNQEIGTEHILYGIAYDPETEIGKLLKDNGMDVNNMERIFDEEGVQVCRGNPMLTDRVRQIFTMAYSLAKQNDSEIVGPEHVLYCMIGDKSNYAFSILTNLFHIDIKYLYPQLAKIISK